MPSAPTAEHASPQAHPLHQEHAVLRVLFDHQHRVVGRLELARAAGLAGLSERRCDSVLVGVRRLLGPQSIITVRSRGWRLAPEAVATAAKVLEQARA
ncbi:MAG: helix-turn-helix domain-containing protein [Acidobacteria bacterium]|nr:helix-turn-helix domain-containing protein [Acidobacteriota bacterium]